MSRLSIAQTTESVWKSNVQFYLLDGIHECHLPVWAYDRSFYCTLYTFLIRILSVLKSQFIEFYKDTSNIFWLSIVRLSNQAWIGRVGTGPDSFIVRRKKEPFPDVNVICAFWLMKSIFQQTCFFFWCLK